MASHAHRMAADRYRHQNSNMSDRAVPVITIYTRAGGELAMMEPCEVLPPQAIPALGEQIADLLVADR